MAEERFTFRNKMPFDPYNSDTLNGMNAIKNDGNFISKQKDILKALKGGFEQIGKAFD